VSIPTDDDDSDVTGRGRCSARETAATLAVSNEAAEWFVRMRDDRLSMRQRQRNVRWLKQSPTHIAELLRIQQVYKVLRAAKLQSQPLASTAESCSDGVASNVSNVIEFASRAHVLPEPVEAPPRFASWKIGAAAACVTLCVLLGFMLKVIWLDRTLRTEPGEWITAQLTDGTQVRIGPNSELRLSFGDNHRTVRLLRGEALFSVAKDPARPFFVQSSMLGVLAVGTEFRVSHWGNEGAVAVTEGSVAVYRDGREPVRGAIPVAPARLAEETGAVALAAGEQVSVTRATLSSPVAKQKINMNYEEAWADGWLVYEDKTVAEIAREFNRRNRLKVVVTDPVLAARRLALFRGRATDPESFASALAVSPDVALVRNDPYELRIEWRPAALRPDESPGERPDDRLGGGQGPGRNDAAGGETPQAHHNPA
jgi:transmembrane sensor